MVDFSCNICTNLRIAITDIYNDIWILLIFGKCAYNPTVKSNFYEINIMQIKNKFHILVMKRENSNILLMPRVMFTIPFHWWALCDPLQQKEP